jgi:uncharacterized protein (DUF2141 family)
MCIILLGALIERATRVQSRTAQTRHIGAARNIMNGPTISTGPRKRISMGVRCVAWFTMLMLVNIPIIAFAQSPCPGIHVKVLNIRNSTGTVACALFESSVGFPTEFLRSATNVMVIKIRKTQARCDFEDIPPGTYAIGVIHDENMNGKLDTNFLGIPTEGYGFSKDAKALIRVPSFSAASFSYDGQNVDLTISLHY